MTTIPRAALTGSPGVTGPSDPDGTIPTRSDPQDTQRIETLLAEQYTRLYDNIDPLPDVLFHYTSGDSAIKILNLGSIWTTQVSCLTDSSELTHAFDLIRHAIQKRELTSTQPLPPLFDELKRQIDPNNMSTSRYWVYVSCLTRARDDLSQWRAYGGSGGFALGFNRVDLTQHPKAHLIPVIYESARQQTLVEILIDDIVKEFERKLLTGPNLDLFVSDWLQSCALWLSCLKHSAYSAEQEWRLVTHASWFTAKEIKFTYINGMLRSHIPLFFDVPGAAPVTGFPFLPLQEIVAGPTAYKNQTRLGMKQLLSSHRYWPHTFGRVVPVQDSLIPYRII